MFLAVLRLKELGGPIAVALQGLVLGGGLAMALLGELRVIDANASVCFGNLSRGMVPCMLLSLHFAMALGEAIDLYLTDDVQSAATWQQVTGDCLVDGVQDAKAEAFRSLQRMPRSYLSHLAVVMGDNFQLRFAREAAALQLSLKCESSPLLTRRDGISGTLELPEATKVEESAKQLAKELKSLKEQSSLSQLISNIGRLPWLPSLPPALAQFHKSWRIPPRRRPIAPKASKARISEWRNIEGLLPTLQL